MRASVQLALLLGLVPLQATVLSSMSIAGVRPDLPLVAAFLVGFMSGEASGVFMGLALGFVQDLFSAGPLWFNLVMKAALGLLGGVLGRHLAHATPVAVSGLLLVLSLVSGIVYALMLHGDHPVGLTLDLVRSVAMPEALLNAVLGGVLFWVLPGGQREEAFREEVRLFGR